MNLQTLVDCVELEKIIQETKEMNTQTQKQDIPTTRQVEKQQLTKSPERVSSGVDDDRWVVVCDDSSSKMLAALGRVSLEKVKPNITKLYRFYTPKENQKFMVDIIKEACERFNIHWINPSSNKSSVIESMIYFFHAKFEERFKPNYLLGTMVVYDSSAFTYLFEILFPLKTGVHIRIETKLSEMFEKEKLPYKLVASTSGRRTAPRALYSIQYADDVLNEISILCKRIEKMPEIPKDVRDLCWRPKGLEFDNFDVDTYFPIDSIMKSAISR